MILRKLITTLICFVSLSAFASLSQKRERLLEFVEQEIQEVRRLSNQLQNRDPSLLLRLAESYLEKARILKEIENEKYLTIPPKKRSKRARRKVFSGSSKYFNLAQKTGLGILKRFKRFKKKSEVYYILAFNAKEFNQLKKAKKYFYLAVKHSKKSDLTNKKSQLALAELLFNEKRYKQAIKVYAPLLRTPDSKWWTKDAFNLAQSYYNVRNYPKAIKLMEKVFQFSKDPNYIDVSDRAQKELALYYASSGKTNQAYEFFNQNKVNGATALIKLGRHLKDRGKINKAEKTLNTALSLNPPREDRIDALLVLLNMYETFANYPKHLKISNQLLNLHEEKAFSDEILEAFKYSVKKVSSILQKQVVSKTYKRIKQKRKEKAQMADAYFDIIASLENKGSEISIFASAETLYSAGEYNAAVAKYSRAYQLAEKSKNRKILKLSVEGMLASLAQKNLSTATKERYLIPAYNRFLKTFPRDKRNKVILEKLFKNYIDKNDYDNAGKVLEAYRSRYPRDSKTQEAMLARIIDYYKGKKDRSKVQYWVGRVRKGEFAVSKGYAQKIKMLILTMQFENVEKLTTQGQKKQALHGYFEIYKSKGSSKEAKKNAAYNIAILFHELGRPDQLYKWTGHAIALMSPGDIKRFDSDYLTMTTELFLRRRFKQSADLSLQVLKKICGYKSKRKSNFFKNAYILYLAEGDTRAALEVKKVGKACGVNREHITTAYFEILKSLEENKFWSEYEKLVTEMGEDKSYWGRLILPLFKIRSVYKSRGRDEYANQYESKVREYYNYAKSRKLPLDLESLDVIAHLSLNKVEQYIGELKKLNLTFPEAKFNKTLEKKFEILGKFTTEAVEVLNIGSGKGIVKAYQYLVETYQQLVNEVRNFTPPVKDQAYVQGFKKSMKGLTEDILKQSYEYIEQAKSNIKENNILSRDNYWFFSQSRLPFRVEYKYLRSGIIMDRGGKR